MTPLQQYNGALEVAVQFAATSGLTLQQICDALILQMASVLGPAKLKNSSIDLDALLEIVRHKLDLQTSSFLHNKSAGVAPMPVAPLRLPPPRPPKEPA